ncbi:MAG: hypothetical protein QF682_01165 [Candidatus Thermoplasmatota archaeon]|nr:hypothetical protein [Candidatus Thermoplasmatota archaeon]
MSGKRLLWVISVLLITMIFFIPLISQSGESCSLIESYPLTSQKKSENHPKKDDTRTITYAILGLVVLLCFILLMIFSIRKKRFQKQD